MPDLEEPSQLSVVTPPFDLPSLRLMLTAKSKRPGRMAEIPLWVLDTNVLVSGILSVGSPPARLVDALLDRRLQLVMDDRIEDEYRRVFARPKFHFDPVRVDAFFCILSFQSMVSAAPWPRPLPPDSSDTMFLEVAHSTSEKTLITGNLKHFPASCRGQVRVHSPREALVMLTGRA